MRALILLLAAAVVTLAVLIVLYVDERPGFINRTGPLFYVGELLADARGGEAATYQERTSRRLIDFKVEQAPLLAPSAVPYKQIRRVLRDPQGLVYQSPGSSVSYQHTLTQHGWFPLMAPEVPDALDRVWVIRSVQPDRITVNRDEFDCWRVDLIDPALPEGSDTVVAWLSAKVPVFGLLKWKRLGETWEFKSGKSAPRRTP
ncbi:MAG: hypothetical protein QNJ90_11235 [Planctomycetota bacterium]|nr:hypothetical protein [Planctomycetota bacterium]